MDSFAATFLEEVRAIAASLEATEIDAMAEALAAVRDRGGRLFVLGVGGGAGHASHAVNDFRKICDLESYTPTDNVSELTARVNDEGWDTSLSHWLDGSRLSSRDAVLVLSVGGGSSEQTISMSIVRAVELAHGRGALVLGIVGRSDGATARLADHCIVIGPVPPERLTPHVESFQAVIWHLLVSHPALARRPGTWEVITARARSS